MQMSMGISHLLRLFIKKLILFYYTFSFLLENESIKKLVFKLNLISI